MEKILDSGETIRERVTALLSRLPTRVQLVAAVKARTPAEVAAVLDAGVTILGENYLQETLAHRGPETLRQARWHFIGTLQGNKVKRAVELFDVIETVHSLNLASEIDRRAREQNKIMDVLVEVNSGREPQKSGVWPEEALDFVSEAARYQCVRIRGLMTMGPLVKNPAELKPCFARVRQLAARLKRRAVPGVTMEYLSMGMSDSWEIAVAEGANLVRIGTAIFGPRPERG